MKILVLLSCTLAAAYAGFAAPYYAYNGAPAETPEVQVAKAQHFAAHAQARSGHYGLAPIAPYSHYYGAPGITHNGLPLDTPEVSAAKLQHYRDYAVAAQRNGVHVPHHAALVSAHPIDTPEVQLAKAAHFAAHAEATARNVHGAHYRRRRGIYGPAYPLHIPVIDHNGVPVETPEVQAAKANHFAEYAKVASRSPAHYEGPTHYSAPAHYAYPQHVPVIGHNGVPLDTPEVQAAKAQHFAALSKAAGQAGHYAPLIYAGPHGPPAEIGPDGHPVETYEVRAAKAAHFAAHAAVRSGGHYGHY